MLRNNTVSEKAAANESSSFFYEDWLMKELDDNRRKAFVPLVTLEEGAIEYRLSFRVQNLRKEHCSLKIDFPYLYVRIQQKENRLPALLRRKPIVHIFARHFFIPYNVDTVRISFVYKGDQLIIRMPKYYAHVE